MRNRRQKTEFDPVAQVKMVVAVVGEILSNRIMSKMNGLGLFIKLSRFISPLNLLALRRLKRYSPGRVKTKLGEIEYVDSVSFLSGVQEIFVDEIYRVNRFSVTPPVVIDCGANIGLSAIYFSETYGARVHAYEADPVISKVLQRNVENNVTKGTVEVTNKAVWVDDKGVMFDVEGAYSGQVHKHGHQLVKETLRLPSVRLRDLIVETGNADFLKLDIEGAENEALLDCAGALSGLDYIFIEWHSVILDSQHLGEILNLLKEEGFRYHIQEAFVSSQPFVRLEEMCGMDLQLNIFAFKSRPSVG